MCKSNIADVSEAADVHAPWAGGVATPRSASHAPSHMLALEESPCTLTVGVARPESEGLQELMPGP